MPEWWFLEATNKNFLDPVLKSQKPFMKISSMKKMPYNLCNENDAINVLIVEVVVVQLMDI